VKLLLRTPPAGLEEALTDASERLGAEVVHGEGEALARQFRDHPDVVVAGARDPQLSILRQECRSRGCGFLLVCADEDELAAVNGAGTDEWVLLPVAGVELAVRLRAAALRAGATDRPEVVRQAAEHLRYEELLYDRFTGFPTLPLMLERGREMLERNGSLTILYIEFVRYTKLEEIYGWQKLDEVIQTSARAVREFYDREHGSEENLLMVSFTGDDDFVFFTDLPDAPEHAEKRISEIAQQLGDHLKVRIEESHGEEIAGLFEIYVGATTLFRNPKVRTERMIYRGIREAAQAARSVEHRERTRKVADLKGLLQAEAVNIVYHPIVVTETREVYGYEALARGAWQGLRSPEVMFSVAEEANLIWELSRLCRRRAVEGMDANLEPHHLLFLNIDPHDFRDPTFRYLDPDDLAADHPERIVLEITERTAITDYPKFQGYLKDFRERGYRFAVDDAGSGYAGLGSIANLAPDFIKLDISLISSIDSNFMKQNLVETMVSFANDQGIRVIAEGVEREEEYETVRQIGVHLTQGFLFHKPQRQEVGPGLREPGGK
jgi:EAL domain-containing protein (putative c-di-GMP-specific phosphodiesterase class I)/GGDEF domain-containing protein